MNFEDLDIQRQKELEMLDCLAESYFTKACAGDQKSAQLLIEISERRAKLLGLDAPTQTQVEVITYDAEELKRQYEILSRSTASSVEISME